MIRERLLDAAGEVFAERGFRDATVREICRRADINPAAINYYFGDKRGIYEEVLRYAHRHAVVKHPADGGIGRDAAPADRLTAFIGALLRKLLDEGRPSWHGKLIAREIIEPTGVLDKLVEEDIRPRYELLLSIVRDLLGDSGGGAVFLCAESIMAQCLFYRHAQPIITRLRPEQGYSAAEIRELADHIVSFSLGALSGYGQSGESRRPDAADRSLPASGIQSRQAP